MKQTRLIMGMPVVIEVVDEHVTDLDIIKVFDYFREIDRRFSTYKPESEISAINAGKLKLADASADMREVFALSEQTKQESKGYFDITRSDGKIDPSGLVKGLAIHRAAKLLSEMGFENYYVDAGGDIEVKGKNAKGELWQIGIRNPFDRTQNVKILALTNAGIATSGTSVRGQHIYNPKQNVGSLNEIVSITVIGPDIYEADRFATPAFAMQREGIYFIESLPKLEAYMIDKDGIATMTSNFNDYLAQ